MGCNQQIIGTNRAAQGLKLLTNATIEFISRRLERQNGKNSEDGLELTREAE